MSLKDELLKAKLINKKELKQIEHEERIERKKIGKKGMEEKQQQRKLSIEESQELKKQQDRIANQQKLDQGDRIGNLIKQGRILNSMPGNRKFYFVARNGKILFLIMSDALAKKLEQGAGIVEMTIEPRNEEFVVVDQSTVEKLLNLCPDIVRFYAPNITRHE